MRVAQGQGKKRDLRINGVVKVNENMIIGSTCRRFEGMCSVLQAFLHECGELVVEIRSTHVRCVLEQCSRAVVNGEVRLCPGRDAVSAVVSKGEEYVEGRSYPLELSMRFFVLRYASKDAHR